MSQSNQDNDNYDRHATGAHRSAGDQFCNDFAELVEEYHNRGMSFHEIKRQAIGTVREVEK